MKIENSAAGMDTKYRGVKAIGGLGRRTDEAGIIERTESGGLVDISGLNAVQRRAPAVYVAGL